MASLIAYITLVWIFFSGTECKKTCFLTNLKGLDVSCNVPDSHATNVTWSLLDTESNKTLILNFCEATICHPFIPRLADTLFVATVTSDESDQYIQTTTLRADVKYANMTKLSNFQQLQCQYNDNVRTVCDTFDVHVNPTQMTVQEIFMSYNRDTFVLLAKTDNMFPEPECTLYLDNGTVENNASFIIEFENDFSFEGLFSNPESDSQFDYVHTYEGACVYELNVTEMGLGLHEMQITASAKTSNKDWNVVMTDVLSINFTLPEVVVPVCNYPEFHNNKVTLTCRTEVVRNMNGCYFEILTNGSSLTDTSLREVKQIYADLLGVPKLVAECSITLDTEVLGPGYHELRINLVTYKDKVNVTEFTSPYVTTFNLSDVYVPGCVYQEVSDEAVIVSCRMNQTDEVVGCEYQAKTNGVFAKVSGNTSLDWHTVSFNEVDTNISECTLTVNPRDLGIGYHQFNLTFLINATTGNLTRISSGFTSPLYFYLPVIESESNINMYSSEESGKWICKMKLVGNPPGSVRWTWMATNGTFFMGKPGNNELTYNYQTLLNYSNFSCEPLSVLKDNLPKLPVELIAKRKQQLLNFTANGKENNLVVDIGSYVTLECLASGYPVPSIKFGHVGTNLSVTTKSPYYTFKVKSCLDAGRYVCTVKQWTEYKSLESNIEILVKCPQRMINAVANPREYITKVKDNLEVMIPVSGYPEPNHYTLLRQSGNTTVIMTGGYKASYRSGDNPDGFVVLEFTDIREEIFTNYTLVFGNGMGTDQEYSFYLTKIGDDQPSDSDTNVAAIVGGVCGGVAAVILIIAVIYFLNRRQKKSSSSNNYVLSTKGTAQY